MATSVALAARIGATAEWPVVGPYTTGCQRASESIEVVGTIVLVGDDLALPASCPAGGDCFQGVRFALRTTTAQVECLVRGEPLELCSIIAFHNTHIRLRMIREDIHPSSSGNFVPVVEVLPGCDTPCSSTELACEATQTCWASPREHCAFCLGGDNEVCACWTADGSADDDARCEFFVSGDVVQGGTCQAGRCIPETF